MKDKKTTLVIKGWRLQEFRELLQKEFEGVYSEYPDVMSSHIDNIMKSVIYLSSNRDIVTTTSVYSYKDFVDDYVRWYLNPKVARDSIDNLLNKRAEKCGLYKVLFRVSLIWAIVATILSGVLIIATARSSFWYEYLFTP